MKDLHINTSAEPNELFGNAEAISDDELQAISGGYSGDNPHFQNVIGTVETRCNYCKHTGTFDVLFKNDAAIVCECPVCQKLLRVYLKDL